MIVPMKKVSLIIMGDKKTETLKKLRKLGMIHIEINEGSGERLNELKEQISLLESAIFTVGTKKGAEGEELNLAESLNIAKDVAFLTDKKKNCQAEMFTLNSEFDRLESWGRFDPESVKDLVEKGIDISFYEIPKKEYEALGDSLKTIKLGESKNTVKCVLINSFTDEKTEFVATMNNYKLELPQMSTEEMQAFFRGEPKRKQSLNGHRFCFAPFPCWTSQTPSPSEANVSSEFS